MATDCRLRHETRATYTITLTIYTMARKQLEPIAISRYLKNPDHSRIVELYKNGTRINRIATITGYGRAKIIRHLKVAKVYIYTPAPKISRPIYNINIKDKDISKDNILKDKEIELNKDKVISNKLDKTNNTSLQLHKLDNILNKLLSMVNNKSVLVDLTTIQKVKAIDLLVAKKVQLKDSTTPGLNKSQMIFNFISNKDFIKDIKSMQGLKNKAIDVKAVE